MIKTKGTPLIFTARGKLSAFAALSPSAPSNRRRFQSGRLRNNAAVKIV